MDSSGAAPGNKNKRVSSDELDDHPKRTCISSKTTGFGIESAEHFFAQIWHQIQPLIGQVVSERFFTELWPQIQHSFRQQVREEIDRRIHSLLPSVSKKDEIVGKAILKLKLCFVNPIESIIFTNNEIKAKNGEALKVVICDVTNNSVVSTGPLSCAQIEFFVLDGDFYSGQPQDHDQITHSTSDDFTTSILTPRSGKRPLIFGSDVKLFLENGVGSIKNLTITDGSFRVRSGTFCLGAKIIDEKVLAEHCRIGEAVSQPFRVMDQRSEGNKKHHPPSREDYVWRLEGIAKNGTYHNNLSSKGINTVGDFLKAYRDMGPNTFKTILGKRVLEKAWKKIVQNAEECVDLQIYETNLVEKKASKESMEELLSRINFEDEYSPSLLPHGQTYCSTTSHELDYKATQMQYYEGVGP